MPHFLEVYAPGELPQRHEVTERLVVGSSNHTDLRLRAHQGLAQHHFSLTPGDDGAALEVLADSATPLMWKGQAQRVAFVPWGNEFFVARLRFALVDEPRTLRPNPWLLLVLLLILAVFGISAVRASAAHDVTKRAVEAPALPGDIATCSTTPEQAAHRATQNLRLGQQKQQHYPFDWRQGIPALKLTKESAVCFRLAGLPGKARKAERAAREQREQLHHDYAMLRLRLQMSLRHSHHEHALAAVEQLQALLADVTGGPYKKWLDALGQQLQRVVRAQEPAGF